ncbi:DNA-binding domain-containing protein [Thalassovita sp.]|uniref:DNA-binding domain-containing protein n=1 Tax=Thalassovita sp. TaxID=1979401 RepID=UPI002B269F86|nr:DNA-binding domain-containing protein [Thalassovita sp.]
MNQTVFRTALLDPMQPVPTGLTDGMGRPAGKRFSVYRNNVTVSLKDALETGFPATARLLGADNFETVSQGYLRSHPPKSPCMMFFGDNFASYIAAIPALKSLGYLPDIARLEYAIHLSYHAADGTALDPGRLADIAPQALNRARLNFSPAVQLIRSDWPIWAIREKALNANAPAPPGTAQPVLITRPQYDPVLHPLTRETAELITALQSGATLAKAMIRAPEADLGQLLALLLAQSALTDIDVEDLHDRPYPNLPSHR